MRNWIILICASLWFLACSGNAHDRLEADDSNPTDRVPATPSTSTEGHDAAAPSNEGGLPINQNPSDGRNGLNCWAPGKTGTVQDIKVLANDAGTVHGFADLVAVLELIDSEGTFPDSSPQYPTEPQYDFTGFVAGFHHLMVWTPPYTDLGGTGFYLPLLDITEPGKQTVAISYFTEQEARDAFSLVLWQQRQVDVNGQQLMDYAGLDFTLTECRNRYYLGSNGGKAVWELRKNTQKRIKAVLPDTVSSLLCQDDGSLIAVTLPTMSTFCFDPTPCKVNGIADPAAVYRIGLDDSVTLLAELPRTLALPKDNITFLKQMPDQILPHGLRVAVAPGDGDSLLVADQIARQVYALSPSGQMLAASDMPAFITSLTKTTSGTIYALRSPVLDDKANSFLQPAAIVVKHGAVWQTVIEFPTDESNAKFFASGFHVDCNGQACMLPFGAFYHLGHDWCNNLYASDPTGRVLAVTLSFD